MASVTQEKNVAELQKEVKLLRSFVIGFVGKDREGEYRPEFVRKILQAVTHKATHTFQNPQSFLRDLQK